LFGTKLGETLLVVVSFICERCGTRAPQRVFKRSTKVTLFFIPLFSLSSSYFVECSNCAAATALTREQATHGVEWAARERQAG
jgi:hypothetical protein